MDGAKADTIDGAKTETMDGVKVEHLWKSYGNKTVLRDVSFHAHKNRPLCFLSPSGSGKTTLLRILTGLEVPDRGRVVLSENFRWAMVFQENRLLEHLDAYANLRFALGDALRGRERETDELLDVLGLADCARQCTGEYSGGMKRRLALARALLAPSDGLALDEPFTGLDAGNHMHCLEAVQRYGVGKTVLCVTHDPADVEALHADIFTFGT